MPAPSETDRRFPRVKWAAERLIWTVSLALCWAGVGWRYPASGGGGLVSLVTKQSTPSNLRLYRLNPKNGKQLWDSYRSPAPSHVDFRGNEILFQFNDKLEVLKFLSL